MLLLVAFCIAVVVGTFLMRTLRLQHHHHHTGEAAAPDKKADTPDSKEEEPHV